MPPPTSAVPWWIVIVSDRPRSTQRLPSHSLPPRSQRVPLPAGGIIGDSAEIVPEGEARVVEAAATGRALPAHRRLRLYRRLPRGRARLAPRLDRLVLHAPHGPRQHLRPDPRLRQR